jgi:hypothetical protein
MLCWAMSVKVLGAAFGVASVAEFAGPAWAGRQSASVAAAAANIRLIDKMLILTHMRTLLGPEKNRWLGAMM